MKEISLDKFTPRDYQVPLIRALLVDGYKRAVVNWCRRAGKDLTALNIVLRKALLEVGTYYLVYPKFSSGRRILWDAITNDGVRFLDFIPAGLIASKNDQQMKITLTNHSQIVVVGSDNYDAVLVGTNVRGMVFSEYALQDPLCYELSRPILNANNGWALFISTPRGKNHFYELIEMAKANPESWFTSVLTVEDTKHISITDIEADIERGEMSRQLARQEYWVDFTMGQSGTFWGEYMDEMDRQGRLGIVSWDPAHPVYTSFDLGIRDLNAIIWFQYINNTLFIIESLSDNNKSLEHYIKVVNAKPYKYIKHFAPHDIKVREYTSGRSRYEIAKQLGLQFTIIETNGHAFPLADSIEVCRTVLPKTYIDRAHNKDLIKALYSYRRVYDEKYATYTNKPVHDTSSHMADSFRYACLGLKKLGTDMSLEELAQLRVRGKDQLSRMPAALNPNFKIPGY